MTDDFMVDIDRFIKTVGDRQDRFMREFTFDLAEQVVEATPVKTGFLRSSWSASIGQPVPLPGGTGFAMTNIALNLLGAKGGDTVYITNSAKYARRIEYGFVGKDSLGREYNQMGRSYIRNTIAKAPAIAEKVIKRINK